MRAVTVLLLALAALGGCGRDDEPSHDLAVERLESRPEGAPIPWGGGIAAGAEWQADARLTMHVRRSVHGGPGPGEARVEGGARIAIRQRFERAAAGGLSTSFSLDYVEAEGENLQHFLALPATHGRADLDAHLRAVPGSLRFEGDANAAAEAQSMIESLFFGGLASSPPWLPPRPVRLGEAWSVAEGFRHPALARIEERRRKEGVELPEATFRATARLEAVREEGAEQVLDVRLDSLLEMRGEARRKGVGTHVEFADRVHGTAVISAKTGLPLSVDVVHERHDEERHEGFEGVTEVRTRWVVTARPTASDRR